MTTRRAWVRFAVTLAFTSGGALAASEADAQTLRDQGPPQHRIVHRNMIGLRANPLGLIWEGRFAYRHRLFASESLALRDNFIAVGVVPSATPAYVRGGPSIEIQPLSIFNVWAQFEGARQFGTFGSLQSFPSATSNYSTSERERLADLPKGDPRRNYAASGSQLSFGATLALKFGPGLFVRESARFTRATFDVRAGDRTFYDSTNDTMAPNRGFYFIEEFDAGWRGMGDRLTLFARFTGTFNLYESSHYIPGERRDNHNDSARLGPGIAYSFFHRDGALFNAPSIFVAAQWWMAHRYRTGPEGQEKTSAAIPLMMVGVQVSGDFLPVKEQTAEPSP